MAKYKKGDEQRCTFCGKNYLEVEKLIAGPPGVYICNDCVEICDTILGVEKGAAGAAAGAKGKRAAGKGRFSVNLLPPAEIKAKLDEYVIGQDWAKRVLSVAVYSHYRGIEAGYNATGGVELEKSNILMMGPTGCGKTLLAQTLARILDVPFAICDATPLTEAGYVGEDVENILLRLIQNADGDIQRAEKGMIYIDEIDKIGRKSANPSITRDVSGEGVQQALLKILEGTTSNVPPQGGRKHPEQSYLQINTKNILFICGGHFEGIEQTIRSRLGKKMIGFDTSQGDELPIGSVLSRAEPEDFMKFGMIPELIGRLPIITALHPLDVDGLVRILEEPKNAIIRQYQKRFELEGVPLQFTPEALRRIAELAEKRKTGARGLRAIVEAVMLDILYLLPEREDPTKEVIITPEIIDRELEKDRHREIDSPKKKTKEPKEEKGLPKIATATSEKAS